MLLRSFLSAIIFCLTLTASASLLPSQIQGDNLLGAGKIVANSDEKKATVVIFLSAKCPCSNSHLVELKSLVKDYPDFAFVAVHSNADEPDAKAYFEKAALPFPVIEDHAFALANELRALKTPHAFVLDKNGKILYQGGVSNSRDFKRADTKFLRSALSDVEAGRAVAIAEGRTLGCEISRGEKNVW